MKKLWNSIRFLIIYRNFSKLDEETRVMVLQGLAVRHQMLAGKNPYI